MKPKSWYLSKTVWTAVVIPLIVWLAQQVQHASAIPGLTAAQLAAVQSVIMIILRVVTAGGLTLT